MQKLTFKALTMKRLNILYFVVVGVVIFLLQLNTQYAKRPLTFFGFAETKETQINMSHPVEVEKIHVISGQEVKKGQLLLEVSYVNIDKKLEQSDFSIAELSAKEKLWAYLSPRVKPGGCQSHHNCLHDVSFVNRAFSFAQNQHQ